MAIDCLPPDAISRSHLDRRATTTPKGFPMTAIRAAAIDIETTGLDPAHHSIVEIAATGVTIDGPATGQHEPGQPLYSSLVDPQCDIPAAASAVHHLTAEDVAGQPRLPEALTALTAAVRAFQPHVLVAHNARFEVGFLPDLAGALTPEDARWACTLRLARHLWPGWAGGFGLQTLRYACRLGHALPDGDPHRAGYDAACVAALLPVQCRALADAGHDVTPALLRDRSAAIPLLARVPFGRRYRGRLWRDVPASFCEWILRTHRTGDPFDPEIVATAEAALRGIHAVPPDDQNHQDAA